ncbi:hypothetical protein [Nocardia bovistercoris]|uniref:Uncharacterized protein n=1 Tax=Nocardia bovistercoris TaxID=2785916 RepID=A0A931N794_9NOCA|nr:hypothetical protein [Nocardia bovistercoris]MBH0780518.1 hypothetical protein [Nocardia bovistercoris]
MGSGFALILAGGVLGLFSDLRLLLDFLPACQLGYAGQFQLGIWLALQSESPYLPGVFACNYLVREVARKFEGQLSYQFLCGGIYRLAFDGPQRMMLYITPSE